MSAQKRRKKSGWGGRREGAGRKPRLNKPVRVTLFIEGDDAQALETFAGAEDVVFSEYIRRVLHRHVRVRSRGRG